MPQSISKYKLYLYLFFFIFLTSIFNFKFLENYKNKFSLKEIQITGLPDYEKKMIEKELYKLQNTNIFKINKDRVSEILNQFSFLEKIYVNKAMPSKINLNLSKTQILGKTFRNGKNFYIGQNGNFIDFDQLSENNFNNTVFGNFKIEEFINLQKILENHQIEINKIKSYYFFKNKRWDLLFSNGLTLKLPTKNLEKSLKIYNKLLKSDSLHNTKIVDLRVNNQIILTNKNE